MDVRVLAYLVLLALATVAFTGAIPALWSSRVELTAALKGVAGRALGSGGRGLVVVEVALACILRSPDWRVIQRRVVTPPVNLFYPPDVFSLCESTRDAA
jgi:hypothetical protein